METWNCTTTVRTFETDALQRWKPTCFFQNMQQAGTQHAASLGYDYESLIAGGKAWVLSRVKIRFDAFPTLDQEVAIRTWPKGIQQKIFFMREFAFTGPGGLPLAVATTAWVLIDINARRMVMPHTLTHQIPDNGGLAAIDELLEKIAAPEDLPERYTIRAGYSAVDQMGHVNNARYVEWLLDSLPYDTLQTTPPRWLQVNYLNEVRPGALVSIRSGQIDGQWWIYGQNLDSGQRAFEAIAAF